MSKAHTALPWKAVEQWEQALADLTEAISSDIPGWKEFTMKVQHLADKRKNCAEVDWIGSKEETYMLIRAAHVGVFLATGRLVDCDI